MPPSPVRFDVPSYDFATALELARELRISHVLAQVLVRRGFSEPSVARRFLAADESHSLEEFGGLAPAAQLILDHVARRSRITVHGDYDVDGVCSSAILIRVLRTLGADVDWFLPSRTEDGYGLASATVQRLASRGTGLLVTADCAVTAVDEVAAARAAGIDVVVDGTTLVSTDTDGVPLSSGGNAVQKIDFAVGKLDRAMTNAGLEKGPDVEHEVELFVSSFALVGTTAALVYGTTEAPSSMTFNVPDLAGRFVL